MDTLRDFHDGHYDHEEEGADVVEEPQLLIGTDERRMHVRAYNHWVSLLRGRAYPSIEDLDPANISDFGPHSVLLDFSRGVEDPGIAFLGKELRDECALDQSITHISQVPSRSLLSRLTDHYLQIIANHAPIGFEAEFVGTRGHNTMYRGILMPFSSDQDSIDYIYGVINWKELVDAETQAKLEAEVAAAVKSALKPAAAWADGPSAALGDVEEDAVLPSSSGMQASLPDQLALARQTAAAVRAADTRSRAALYRALGRAYDFAHATAADPTGYEALLAEAGISMQLRAPMTPVVKLVFGADYDKTRLAEYAAVLAHAHRKDVRPGGLREFLDGFEGGIKGVVKAERDARRSTSKMAADPGAVLRKKAALATLALETPATQGDYVVLLARAAKQGMLDIVAAIGSDDALTKRVMKQAAA